MAVAQGGGAAAVVEVYPGQDGLVLAADVCGAGGGVELAGGDEVKGVETLAGAVVFGMDRSNAQVFDGLPPPGQLDAHHASPRLGPGPRSATCTFYQNGQALKLPVSLESRFKAQRKTRFLTVLNLKGGVGKTTLAANLAACLAGDKKRPLRILLIDVDFQGTLGRATVDEAISEVQRQHDALVNLLLTQSSPDDKLLQRLTVPMYHVAEARVILATDSLDADEFQLQARFFVDPVADPRFQFRRHFHREAFDGQFDLVIFDCPPRITTSVVNAVACSDWVLIPTKLDRGSIDAVPRTVAWMTSLGANCPAEVLGVVASHVAIRGGKKVQADQQSYEDLQAVVDTACGPGADNKSRLFKAVIRATNDAIGAERGEVASVSPTGQLVFADVVAELRGKMQL